VTEFPHERISQDAVMVAMAQDTDEEVQGEFPPAQNSTVADTTGEVFDEKD
jgi:hypothetical protein